MRLSKKLPIATMAGIRWYLQQLDSARFFLYDLDGCKIYTEEDPDGYLEEDVEQSVKTWAKVKREATEALTEAGYKVHAA